MICSTPSFWMFCCSLTSLSSFRLLRQGFSFILNILYLHDHTSQVEIVVYRPTHCAVTPLVYSRSEGLPGCRCLHLERSAGGCDLRSITAGVQTTPEDSSVPPQLSEYIGVARGCSGCTCTPQGGEKIFFRPNLQEKCVSASPQDTKCTPKPEQESIFRSFCWVA